jgi:4,5-DOPA dioxygenase extradiol
MTHCDSNGRAAISLVRRRLLAAGAAGVGIAAASAAGASAAANPDGTTMTSTSASPPQSPEPAARRRPVLFVGHGSPMNIVADNAFTKMLARWGAALGKPKAILMVSAHWLTERDVQVSTTATPETIYDFYGFPQVLYTLKYAAPGAPDIARHAAAKLAAREDAQRGLDHGTWSVLRHMYPQADIPTFQLSIDITKPGSYHHALGRSLASLRDEDVLIVGSGNIVHNLRATMRGAPDSPHGLTPWAEEFDARAKAAIDAGDAPALMAYDKLTPGALTAVPFPDHYFPLLYAMGATGERETAKHVYEGFQAGTLSMRCVQWG